MKDFIYTNYNLKVDKIYNNYFFIGDEKIIIYKVENNINYLNKLFNITNNMYNDKLYINTFILNNKGLFYTPKDDKLIILSKVNDRDTSVTVNYLYKFNNYNIDFNDIDILSKWKNQIDTLEERLIEYNKEHLLVLDSVNYFIGMSENAISLLSEYNINKGISHDITYLDYSKDSFNDPFNLVNINKLYDISLYIKYNFYNNTLDYDELYNILIDIDNEEDEAFLFSSLLYRNCYFDVINKILDDSLDEKSINLFIDNIKSYEELLCFCKNYLKKCKLIQLINWID